MCIRRRKKPIPLEKLEVLIPRLHPHHPKIPQLEKQAARYLKGWNGERKLDYHLKGLPTHFAILNDVTLHVFDKTFQIYSLIYSPYAIYLIEVKNIAGPVTFNTTLKQFIQHNGERLTGYKYPITEVEMIHYLLQSWLQQRNVNTLPIYHYIAFAEHETVYNVIGEEEVIRKVVSYVEEIPLRVMKTDEYISKTKKENNELKSKLIRTTLREYEDFDFDILGEFNIKQADILRGVHCPGCGNLGMERIHGKGRCKTCGTHSKTAYERALYEYGLIISPIITNKTCRQFLQLNNRHEANYILRNQTIFDRSGQKWMKR